MQKKKEQVSAVSWWVIAAVTFLLPILAYKLHPLMDEFKLGVLWFIVGVGGFCVFVGFWLFVEDKNKKLRNKK